MDSKVQNAQLDPPVKINGSDAHRSVARKQNQSDRLLLWHELPSWQQDNEYLLSAYRPVSFSYLRSLKSIFTLHNQSVNIHTHLIGAVVCISCWLWFHYDFVSQYSSVSKADIFVFNCFFLGAAICLSASTVFHTLANHSEEVCQSCLMLDMIGILCLTIGSFFPGVYYGFYCENEVIKTYWSMITILGVSCMVLCTIPHFQTLRWKSFRTLMFVMVGLSGVLPMSHAVRLFGVKQANLQMGWSWFVWEAVFYISGAAIYASRIPERWVPGKFDLYGASHQIFHVLVLLGAWSHFTGVVKAFHYNHNPQTRRC